MYYLLGQLNITRPDDGVTFYKKMTLIYSYMYLGNSCWHCKDSDIIFDPNGYKEDFIGNCDNNTLQQNNGQIVFKISYMSLEVI